MNQKRTLILYLCLSAGAGILISLLVLFSPEHRTPLSILDSQLIGGVGIGCCVLGLSCVLYPNRLRRFLRSSEDREVSHTQEHTRVFQGHHPNCPLFDSHRVRWNNKEWCAGCLGLGIGLMLSIGLMLFFMTQVFQVTRTMVYMWLMVGFLLILLVYAELFRRSQQGVIHLLVNSGFIPGCTLVILSVVQLTGNLLFGLFTLLLCFLWVDTRMQLSEWQHHRLCSSCSETCKMYSRAGVSVLK
ncbi:MAG: hypothetical protein JXA00_04070 [Candidatus Thermoplasmatota archaeon]|nr:hypothetical protein [Candidatus Thermoplasmatota archaeon]